MNRKEVLKLNSGSEVWWKDPDNNTCSRSYTIRKINIKGDVIGITDIDGNYIECYSHELE